VGARRPVILGDGHWRAYVNLGTSDTGLDQTFELVALASNETAFRVVWQDLVDGHGFSEKYSSVKRFVRKLRGSPTPEARVVIQTAPGEEAQVDYGTGPMVRDPHTGKYRRTRLFVLTLGHSRKAVRLLVFRSSSRVWAGPEGKNTGGRSYRDRALR